MFPAHWRDDWHNDETAVAFAQTALVQYRRHVTNLLQILSIIEHFQLDSFFIVNNNRGSNPNGERSSSKAVSGVVLVEVDREDWDL